VDFSNYLMKNRRASSRTPDDDKFCLECGIKIVKERTDPHLYRQKFCSEHCKERYVSII